MDQQERRREIIEALWRVTVRDGLGAVSFREVAAEAGVSVRRVQYYFGTKAQLLYASLMLLGELIVGRGLERIQALGPDPAPEARLRAALLGSQPLDDDSRRDVLLFFCFYIEGLTDRSLGTAIAASQQFILPFLTDLLRQAADRREIQTGVDPELEAGALLAVNTGLSLSVLAGRATPEDAIAVIDYRLDRIFVRPSPARRSVKMTRSRKSGGRRGS